jgi:predicted esterase
LEAEHPKGLLAGRDTEAAVKWVAAQAGEKGLTRAYSDAIDECSSEEIARQGLLDAAISQLRDPDLIDLLQKIVRQPGSTGDAGREILTPVLTTIAMQNVDHMLEQISTIGRRDGFLHATAARYANTIVVLTDHESQYDWILPAARRRFHEELSRLRLSSENAKLQSVDLERGEKLQLLGYELRRVVDRAGKPRVDYKCLVKPRKQLARDGRWSLHYHPLAHVRRFWGLMGIVDYLQIIRANYRKAMSIQVGWHHLPITLYPILALVFGWRSPIALLCAVIAGLGNWRITSKVLALLGRRPGNLAVAGCGLAVAICLSLLIGDLYANVSCEVSAPNMPPDFYLGRYNKGSLLDPELVRYGLYVPPHFKNENGPFPLIVFLHGHKESNERVIFMEGVPRSIANAFGPGTPNGQFPFVAFFPIAPWRVWEPGTPGVNDAILVLDHVVRQHRIDPSRIYLTGHSGGGDGVWRLADAYPHKWAALAPLSAHFDPDVQKVRHIPTWIFHAAKDKTAPVARERTLVQRLKEAKADVRYTELPTEAHVIQGDVYDSKEIYDWFATKKKNE